MNCITNAWEAHETELRNFIRGRVNNSDQAEDLLQDIFIKGMAEGSHFCELENARAWLFKVARNLTIDSSRLNKKYMQHDSISDDFSSVELNEAKTAEAETQPVANLAKCLPIALEKLDIEDQEIIQHCDLDGLHQADFAKQKSISLTATKSRIQRARKRLKEELQTTCKIIFDEQGNVCCFGDDIKNKEPQKTEKN